MASLFHVHFDKAGFMAALAEAIEASSRSAWAAETDPSGEPWLPRISGGSHSLLQLTGAMLGSIEFIPDANAIRITGNEIAVYHQFGTSKMAAREIADMPPDMAETAASLYEQFLNA